jgi:CheY-like chemotaxis protein
MGSVKKIKKIHRDAKVIFVSGYAGDVILDKGFRGERVDFFSKPLSPIALLKAVREVLDR